MLCCAVLGALPDGIAPCRSHHSGNAHVLCSADGRHVYATTRTDGAVVSFGVDSSTGVLTKLQTVSCGGVCPRNFILDGGPARLARDGAALARLRVGNQDSQNLVTYKIGADGCLVEPPDQLLSLDGVCPNVLTLPTSLPAWQESP